MADDDDKPKKHTLDSLFVIYSNFRVISQDLDNEEYDCILLSQIDYWLEQAKLIPAVFTRTQTGLAYMRFKKWRLGYEDFLEFLTQICNGSHVQLQDIKDQLVEAGVPRAATDIVIIK